MATKKKPQPRVVCDDCDGHGCTWSEHSLVSWGYYRDDGEDDVDPPDSWRDLNCVRCQGAGYLDLKTGGPLLERLIDSAAKRVRRGCL